MCGRYSMTLSLAEFLGRFGVDLTGLSLRPRYNLAPGQEAPVILANNNGRQVKMMNWGLIPHWAKDPSIGYKTINARAETVAVKPAFRDALRRRRCLIPADGFYEWAKKLTGRTKTPFRFVLKDGSPFAFAGLWDRWLGIKESPVSSFTIITTQANPLVAKVHDRMPVILSRENEEKWLNPDLADPSLVLKPYPAESMEVYEVGTVINSAKNDGPECISRISNASS